MKKLISMTDFILEQRMTSEEVNASNFQQIQNHINTYYDKVYAYANFLKQPLKLEMFVPCVEGEPIEYVEFKKTGGKFCPVGSEIEKEAKEKVLFKGFPVKTNQYDTSCFYIGWESYMPSIFIKERNKEWKIGHFKTVEDLLFSKEIKLTESAIKQIGL